MDCCPPGSSVLGILQARILEWVAMPSSSRSSQLRDWSCISCRSCIGRQILSSGDRGQILYYITSLHALPLVLHLFSQENKSYWASMGLEFTVSLINQRPKRQGQNCWGKMLQGKFGRERDRQPPSLYECLQTLSNSTKASIQQSEIKILALAFPRKKGSFYIINGRIKYILRTLSELK